MSDRYTSTDSLRRTFAFIEVDGETFDWWEQYQLVSDILNGTNGFAFRAPILPREPGTAQRMDFDARGLRRGQPVKVYIKTPQAAKPVLQYTGLIDAVTVSEDRNGAYVSVSGRDHMAPIYDSHVLPSIGIEKATLAEVVVRLLTRAMPGQRQPFYRESDIILDNEANRVILTGKPPATGAVEKFLAKEAALAAATSKKPTTKRVARAVQKTIDQVKPRAGETIYGYLARHAQRFGLMIWGTADGKVVVGRPNYDQSPLYTLRVRQGVDGAANNVESIQRTTSFKHRPSEVHVYGKSNAGGDELASDVHAVVYDEEVRDFGLWRALTIHDTKVRTIEEAEHRAYREMSLRREKGDVIQATVMDHCAADGAVYAIDTIASVQWDAAEINDAYYVASRTFERTRGDGTKTRLELIPKNSIALSEEEDE